MSSLIGSNIDLGSEAIRHLSMNGGKASMNGL